MRFHCLMTPCVMMHSVRHGKNIASLSVPSVLKGKAIHVTGRESP
jgi:hypothetical protein